MSLPMVRLTLLIALAAVASSMRAEPGSDRPGLDSIIAAETIDLPLLRESIFAATNRVRREHGLREFEPSTEADAAAEIQARLGSVHDSPSHTNPFPRVATPLDRANWVGLRAAMLGENVARVPVLDTGGRPDFEVRRLGGRVTFHDIDTGRELNPHTYASFGTDVVARWMASPGHRANILKPGFRRLGLGVHLTKSRTGAEVVHAVQLFVTLQKGR